jgi:predicted DNA-binding protein (MmcQ/YjbR family)
MVKDDPALRRVRAFCLALPEASEAGSWGHPNFRVGKKTFAAFEWITGRPSVAFRLNGVDVDLLLRRRNFFATPYGRRQWVSVWADRRVSWRLVERLLLRSYRLVALKRMIAARENSSPSRRRAAGGVKARGVKK